MSLLYKPDWEETKERFKAWWAGDAIGRCGLAVTAPRKDAKDEPPPEMPSDPIQRWTDLDYFAAANDWSHSRTFYGGEAFPIWSGGYPGHASIPSYLGSRVDLDMHTGWHQPILNGETWALDDLKLDRENEWWKFNEQMLQRAAAEAKGKSIPGVGAFGGCGDTLAALRDTNRLLLDVIDRPELVKATELHLMDLWCEVYSFCYDIVHEAAEGSTCWFSLWSPGRFYSAHCDFSYMISPKMFRDLFLPTIEKQTQYLDHAVYHVDGIEAFNHVPALLELPRLHALQILPGAGKPSPLYYMDVLKQVQAGGRNLHISIPASEVETALTELSARGLFIGTSCGTEEEARALLKRAEKLSHD